jgi:carboxypeptidase C (cathepsin A)
VLGESYGTQRAAFMAGQLAPVMPLDGVFLFGQAVNMIETSQRAKNVLAYATNLPALAAVAAYHGRAPKPRSYAALADETYAWGMGEYLQALLQGYELAPARRRAIADRLAEFTGIPAAYYLDHDLQITKIAFALTLLKDQGRMVAPYDARYAGPGPAPGVLPADPFGKVRAAVEPMMQAHLRDNLGVTWDVADYRPLAPGSDDWTWAPTLGPGGPFLDYDYPARLTPAFAANPRFRLMIGTGYFDLTTTIGPARYLVTKSDWPRERVVQRQYFGGHMAYSDDASHRAFTDDIRAWVGGGLPGPMQAV